MNCFLSFVHRNISIVSYIEEDGHIALGLIFMFLLIVVSFPLPSPPKLHELKTIKNYLHLEFQSYVLTFFYLQGRTDHVS